MKIGVAVNHVEDLESGLTPPYHEIREMARAAEAGGLDSIWLYDHLLLRRDPETTNGIWECWTMLSALAEATHRVELGTLVLCNPFRNPGLLAKMAHTLDEVSGGRLILGLGAGWHQPEFDAFGFPFDRRVGRLEESLEMMTPLLRGESVDFDGNHYQASNAVVRPVGPRSDGIPLLVAAFGPRMMGLAARYADLWNTAWLGDAKELAERVEQMEAACRQEGRDPATLEVTVGVSAAFPDLGKTSPYSQEPLTGSAADVAQALHDYARAGAGHLIFNLSPWGRPALERLAESARLYRAAAP
jgi:probable F420-dependent oxidoreductase